MARASKSVPLQRLVAKPAAKNKKQGALKSVRVNVVRMPHAEGLPLPTYQSAAAAGLDLAAALPDGFPLVLAPGARALVPTGLVLELPRGFEGQVRPRSGLALRQGVTVLNSPGTIDADYRGEVQVILVNLGPDPVEIARGERIAQLIIAPVVQAELFETRAVSQTARGSGGFGSTGKAAAAARATTKKKAAPPKVVPAKRKSAKAR